jgi:hypothetical protein
MTPEEHIAATLGDNFYSLDDETNRIYNSKTKKLLPRMRMNQFKTDPVEPIKIDRTPFLNAILSLQEEGATPIYSLDNIKIAVSTVSGVPIDALMSGNRAQKIARARQVVFYLARLHTKLSLPAIGRNMGGKDHSTVHHGWERVTQRRFEFVLVLEPAEALLRKWLT